MNATITSTTAQPTKLRNGSWGAKIVLNGGDRFEVGTNVTVKTKAGKSWTTQVAQIVWSGPSAGNKAYIFATTSGPATDSAPRKPRRKACRTDGNCSSFGSGRSCGGYDCDGR